MTDQQILERTEPRQKQGIKQLELTDRRVHWASTFGMNQCQLFSVLVSLCVKPQIPLRVRLTSFGSPAQPQAREWGWRWDGPPWLAVPPRLRLRKENRGAVVGRLHGCWAGNKMSATMTSTHPWSEENNLDYWKHSKKCSTEAIPRENVPERLEHCFLKGPLLTK